MTTAELLELMHGTPARRWVPRTAKQLEAWVLQQREFRDAPDLLDHLRGWSKVRFRDDPFCRYWGEPPYRLKDWPDGWVEAAVVETCRFWREVYKRFWDDAQFCSEYLAGKRFMPSDGPDSACA